jgi:hypothetical protein
LVGVAVIAVTPVAPPPPALVPRVHIPEVHLPAVQLSASIAEIFTFPTFQQFVVNQIDDVATLSVGLASSAGALGQSIAMIPTTLATVTQQVLSGDLLGALTTIETAIVGSVVAVGEPTLAAIIERRQRLLAVQSALQVAVPEAFIDVVGGVAQGADEALRAFITAGQGLVDAVLSLNPGNIAAALVNGTTLVLGSFVDGGQHVVDGIVSAQQTLATALAAQPAASSATALSANISSAEVTAVPDRSRKAALVAVDPPTGTAEVDAADPAAGTTVTTTKTESDRDFKKVASPKAKLPKPTRTTAHPRTLRRPRRTNPTSPPRVRQSTRRRRSAGIRPSKKPPRPTASPKPEAPSRSNAPAQRLSDLQRSTPQRAAKSTEGRRSLGGRLHLDTDLILGLTLQARENRVHVGCVKR